MGTGTSMCFAVVAQTDQSNISEVFNEKGRCESETIATRSDVDIGDGRRKLPAESNKSVDEQSDVLENEDQGFEALFVYLASLAKRFGVEDFNKEKDPQTEEYILEQFSRSFYANYGASQKEITQFRVRVAKLALETGVIKLCVKISEAYLHTLSNRAWSYDRSVVPITALCLLGNYSDVSDELTIYIVQNKNFLMKIKDFLTQAKTRGQAPQYYEFYSHGTEHALRVLQNVAMRKSNVEALRQLVLNDLLTEYLGCPVKINRLLALATLAAIVTEEECSILVDNQESVKQFLSILGRALKEKNKTCDGWSCKELALIVRQLGRNDANKKMLVSLGALELLVELGNIGDEEEQYESVEAIWALCFDDGIKRKVSNSSALGVVELLFRLKGSGNRGIRKACKGALWLLKDSLSKSPVNEYKTMASEFLEKKDDVKKLQRRVSSPLQSETESTTGHIMISYQWKNQDVLKKVRDRIRSSKYKVWMDIDNMTGSTIAAMADAVEKSSLVLMCMSSRYKDSPNCRLEAEYAFQLKKPMIPLKMERNYQPDGWLGILLGTKLFYEFTEKYPFETKVEGLLIEIGKVLQGETLKVDPVQAPKQTAELKVLDEVDSAPPPSNQQTSRGLSLSSCDIKMVQEVRRWSNDEITKWRNKNNLKGCLPETVSASEIAMLLQMHQDSHEYLYQCLEKMYNMTDPLAMSKVIWALQDIVDTI